MQLSTTQVQHVQKALDQMNLQLHHVISDITGTTGLKIVNAILAGEAKSLVGDYREEHLFTLRQSLTAYPNPNKYATAASLAGPWSEFKDIAPPETNTYGSQSTMMLKVIGSKTTTVIFMADIWKPKTQWDSRYLWMPLQIGGGKLWLPPPAPWTLDLR